MSSSGGRGRGGAAVVAAGILLSRLFGLVHAGPWFHVGTPDDLAATEKELIDLSGRARRS